MCISQIPHNCFVPPFILQEISQNGTPAQQEHARQNLASSWQFRITRSISGERFIQDIEETDVSLVMERMVYDAEFGSLLPGKLVRGEGDLPTNDVAVNEAYDGAGATYTLFRREYGRNSIDDRGLPIISTVHYRIGYDNAFWNGRQMVYGDGDEDLPESQRIFNRFTSSLEVIGHELTHGVTQYETGLLYNGQSGALNESLSDVFGVLVTQYVQNQAAAEADWLIGSGLFTEHVNGRAIRSMKAPGTAYDDPVIGKDPQPAHMDDYVVTSEDSGGVHINSGILNRAFYLTSMEIGGKAWEKAGQIWYVTLRDKLFATAVFDDMAKLTFETAGELYGKGSLEQKAVRFGWQEVGLSVGQAPGGDNGGGQNPAPPDGSDQPGCFQSVVGNTFLRYIFG